MIAYPVKTVFAAKALRIAINIESDSTTVNQKENDIRNCRDRRNPKAGIR